VTEPKLPTQPKAHKPADSGVVVGKGARRRGLARLRGGVCRALLTGLHLAGVSGWPVDGEGQLRSPAGASSLATGSSLFLSEWQYHRSLAGCRWAPSPFFADQHFNNCASTSPSEHRRWHKGVRAAGCARPIRQGAIKMA